VREAPIGGLLACSAAAGLFPNMDNFLSMKALPAFAPPDISKIYVRYRIMRGKFSRASISGERSVPQDISAVGMGAIGIFLFQVIY
jgi:hypothetical protein